MAILNNSVLRARAAEASRTHREENRRLVLVYCGVLAVLSLGSAGLNLLLDSQIGQTGGLDGVGLRTVLETVEEILYYVNMFFGPFWSAGFLWAMLRMVRGGTPRLADLGSGFRRLGQILGHMAFQFLTITALSIMAVNLAAVLFSFSSWGEEFNALLEPVLQDPNLITPEGAINMALIPMEALTLAAIPMLVLTLVIFVPVYLYLSMCFRMSMYLVVERPISGARAHLESARLMRGHKWQMLKLDLSYWWYYLLGLGASLVAYLDQLLPLMGVQLPQNSHLPFFLAMGLYWVVTIALSVWKKCEVDAAHLMAYEAIAHPQQEGAQCREISSSRGDH